VTSPAKAIEVACTLGPRWLAFRAAYALRQRCGYDARRQPVAGWDQEPLSRALRDPALATPVAYAATRRHSPARFFFTPARMLEGRPRFGVWDASMEPPGVAAARVLGGEFPFFSHHWRPAGLPPDWHLQPLTGQRAPSQGHWSRLDEFGSGDIKWVWELSRFSWVFPLARAYARTGEASLAECFWNLVEDWRSHNPPRAGVHWKCGQEISFRAMAWCFGMHAFAGAAATTPERVAVLAQMLAVSGRRIVANLPYALSQANNHGVSEAAGLWTLGLLFPEFGEAPAWRARGREALERQARELIYEDGGFSQHSFNYHRVMLDDCLWCLALGQANQQELSADFRNRVARAGRFLSRFCDPATGRLPNWGANDGALVLPLSNCGYLDYRPVIQAAARWAGGPPTLPPGPWDEQAWWLGDAAATSPTSAPEAAYRAEDFADSGLSVLRSGPVRAVVRTVRHFRHRPGHCDPLHLDLWLGSENLLRDCGTFSYNDPENAGAWFGSVAAHNTVQFDGREPMPKLSRFLYGRWLRGTAALKVNGAPEAVARYTDWQGGCHERTVRLEANRCEITDRLSGFRDEAVLRWHLSPDHSWALDHGACVSPRATLRLKAEAGLQEVRLGQAWESLYYGTRTPIPVLEARLTPACRAITTLITWAT
jgi:hypothetical protein